MVGERGRGRGGDHTVGFLQGSITVYREHPVLTGVTLNN